MNRFWAEIQDEVGTRIEQSPPPNRSIWFRGQKDGWPLLPKLHRNIRRHGDESARPEHVRERSRFMYLKFKRLAWALLAEEDRSPWGVFCAMQHYGCETRLLDWTESFACAVYFAMTDCPEGAQPTIVCARSVRAESPSRLRGHRVPER